MLPGFSESHDPRSRDLADIVLPVDLITWFYRRLCTPSVNTSSMSGSSRVSSFRPPLCQCRHLITAACLLAWLCMATDNVLLVFLHSGLPSAIVVIFWSRITIKWRPDLYAWSFLDSNSNIRIPCETESLYQSKESSVFDIFKKNLRVGCARK